MPRTRYDDDEAAKLARILADAEDDNDTLRDGEVLRVPLRLADGSMNPALDQLQRAIAQQRMDNADATRFGLNDALAVHRPGYRYQTDERALAIKDEAYSQYNARIGTAYRDADHTAPLEGAGEHGFAFGGRAIGDLCTVRNVHSGDLGEEGDAGTVRRVGDRLCCVSDRYYREATGAEATSDGLTDERDAAYEEHRQYLENSWRTGG